METLISNIGKPSRRWLKGREYIVAPVTMLVEGVLNGSKGPLFYPMEEISMNPSLWNHMPITVNHPIPTNGASKSARDPEILNNQAIGLILKSHIEGNKLRGEAWIDVLDAERVDNRIILALEKGESLEVSTGLFTQNEKAQEGATFNGKSYAFIARGYQPDHLAILLDEAGACSVKDGCGVNNSNLNPDSSTQTHNELSHSDLNRSLEKQVDERFGSQLLDSRLHDMTFILDIFDKTVIFKSKGKTWELGYTKSNRKNEAILSSDSPREVTRVTTFKPVKNESSTPTTTNGDTKDMSKQEIITYLVSNCDCWKGQEETLNQLSDERLTYLKEHAEKQAQHEAVANAAREGYETIHGKKPTDADLAEFLKKKTENPAPQQTKSQQTTNKETSQPAQQDKLPAVDLKQWLESMPAEARSVWNNAVRIEQQERDSLITSITENAENPFSKEQLQQMDLGLLRDLSKLAGRKEDEKALLPPVYGGQGSVQNRSSSEEDILPLPSMDLSEAVS